MFESRIDKVMTGAGVNDHRLALDLERDHQDRDRQYEQNVLIHVHLQVCKARGCLHTDGQRVGGSGRSTATLASRLLLHPVSRHLSFNSNVAVTLF